MIILDDSYVSRRMVNYLVETQQPVLQSEMAMKIVSEGARIAVVAEQKAIERINAGERLYAMSESHFGWIMQNVREPNIIHGLSVFKDKERMRSLLAPMYPNFMFQALSIDELLSMSYPAAKTPFVLKPSVGFLSLGIYIIRDESDWNEALQDIQASKESWSQWYDSSVIKPERFIMESLVTGTEYALDAYYDEDGCPHLLNILRHDFASESDTSDRLYVCGKQVMQEKRDAMMRFLADVNDLAQVRNFPVHVEVRDQDGVIYPIEFNALRFAGLGGTEVSKMAFGFFTFDHYLHGTEPDWDAAFDHAGDDLYCMSVLNPPAGTPAGAKFDYDTFLRSWKSPIDIDKFNFAETGIMGFLFWKTSAQDDAERIRMLNDDLRSYLHAPSYSPNRRNPHATRDFNPEHPIPPMGYNAQEENDSNQNQPTNPFFSARQGRAFPGRNWETDENGRYIPTQNQKFIWSGAGFLAGLLGVFVIFIAGCRRPKPVRNEMLKFALIGLAAGFAIDLVFMLISGGSMAPGIGSPLSLFGLGGGTGPAPTSGSVF